MQPTDNHYANAGLMIRKPVGEVFQAFIDPAITTNFWFTKSTGNLEEGKKVEWFWEMYNVSAPVTVREIVPNEKILIRWGNGNRESTVEWTFKKLGDSKTYVSVVNSDFTCSPEEMIEQIRDATGGFTSLLAGAKIYLEHGINPNFVGDKYPEEMRG